MGRDQHADGQIAQEAQQRAPRTRVEASRGLVERENLGIHAEHRGDGDALLFAGAQVMAEAILVGAHAYTLERMPRSLAHLGGGQPHVQRPEGHILDDRRRKQLVVRILEHQADRGADCVKVVVAHGSTTNAHLARAAQDAVQMQQQRALASAVRSHQRHLLSGLDGERHAAQGRLTIRIAEREIIDGDDRLVITQISGTRPTIWSNSSTAPTPHTTAQSTPRNALACSATSWPR